MPDDLEFTVKADTDKAAADVDKLADKLDHLEGSDVEVSASVDATDRATPAIEGVQSELREVDGSTAEATVTADTSQAEGALGQLTSAFGAAEGGAAGLTDTLGQIAGKAGPAGTAIAAAAAAGFALADSAANQAIELGTLAQITGESIAQTSQLAQVWKTTGADANDLADVIAQTNQVLADQPELAKQLGIELKNASPQDVFVQAVEAASGLEDSQTRLRIGAQLFGEEGVRQVAGVTARYADLSDAIASTDPLFDDEDFQRAQEYDRQVTRLKAQLSDLAATIGMTLLPVLSDVATVAAATATPLASLAGASEGFMTAMTSIPSPIGAVSDALGMFSGEEDGATEAMGGATEGAAAQGGAMTGLASDTELARQASANLRDEMQQMADARRASADASIAYSDALIAIRDTAAATAEAEGAMNAAIAAHGAGSAEATAATQTYEAAVRSERDAVLASTDAAATLAGEQARATGATDTAAIENDAYNESLLTSAANTTGPVHQALVDHIATLNGIPPEEVTNILANTPNLAAQKAAIDAAAADRTATINVEFVPILNKLENAYRAGAAPRPSAAMAPAGAAPAGVAALGRGAVAAPAAFPLYGPAGGGGVVINVDARGALDPYSVGREVERVMRRWGRVAGTWRPGVTVS